MCLKKLGVVVAVEQIYKLRWGTLELEAKRCTELVPRVFMFG